MLNIEIDGKKLQVEPGSMVIEAADAVGIYIPRFCYHKKLSVAANCRMCLVDVEKVAKPLPACATPVTEGMRVFTQSGKTKEAQRGVMEFLLINHPLDCPICDEGGECDLQDLAMGYGHDISRYDENKRVVKDKDLGPLIATEMTRCIHCTRCVRFGQEIAGLMELGATGRGEHMEIGTYIERSVDSELSGNMIDLCPVGALTSKPFRFTARAWELKSAPSVSPHDCVGANLRVQTRGNQVMRVLPGENEEINEVWLSDRDRFSYAALNSPERLEAPMIRLDGEWQATDWATALEFTAAGLRKVVERHGAGEIGALASPTATVEEFYLLQKLLRSLGSENIDHRLRQRDFSLDNALPLCPWLGQGIRDLEELDAALLIASNVRKEEPILALRLRKAFLGGAKLMAVNPVDYPFNFGLSAKVVASPFDMLAALGRIARSLSDKTGKAGPARTAPSAGQGEPSAAEQAIAETLSAGGKTTVLLGSFATMHPRYGDLRSLAELIAELSGATFGELCQANGAGAWLAGCVPHRGPAGVDRPKPGRHAYSMVETPLKAYLLWGVEPELDAWDGGRARAALAQAEFVVSCSLFKTTAAHADVQLPLAAFTETEGTFVNCEGRAQSFAAAVKPLGEARPGWKILRVLGNLLRSPGFEYVSVEEVRAEIPKPDRAAAPRRMHDAPIASQNASEKLVRVAGVLPYAVDALVRRAPPLLKTADNPKPSVHMNPTQAAALGVAEAKHLRLRMETGEALLPLVIDPRLPDGCVWVPAGYPETTALPAYGPVMITQG